MHALLSRQLSFLLDQLSELIVGDITARKLFVCSIALSRAHVCTLTRVAQILTAALRDYPVWRSEHPPYTILTQTFPTVKNNHPENLSPEQNPIGRSPDIPKEFRVFSLQTIPLLPRCQLSVTAYGRLVVIIFIAL